MADSELFNLLGESDPEFAELLKDAHDYSTIPDNTARVETGRQRAETARFLLHTRPKLLDTVVSLTADVQAEIGRIFESYGMKAEEVLYPQVSQ